MARKPFNDFPFPYHHELELEIHELTNLGSGLGRVPLECGPAQAGGTGAVEQPAGGGWVVMVPFALPGERVRARVFRNHRNFSEADLAGVIRASPQRVEPRCPLFGRCGGCQYQHLDAAGQLEWKRRQVAGLLRHLAGVEGGVAVNPVHPSPRVFGYRSKITPHHPPPRRADGGGGAAEPVPIGFLAQGSRSRVIDVPRCELATDAINARLVQVRAEVRAGIAERRTGATLLLRDAAGGVTTDPSAVITEEIPLPAGPAGPGRVLRLQFLARDFFQNNPFVLPEFVAHVITRAASGGARFLVDAYCGSGLFCLAGAGAFEAATGVEISASAIDFARANAAANGIANVTFQAGDAAAIFAGLPYPPGETAVVIDPPRSGCGEPFVAQLLAFRPRTIVYVSCDPATQMRDIRGIIAEDYTLFDIQPFDLFPQTRHIECIAVLNRRI